MTAAVILAAGAGSRLGGVAKALLEHGERTFLSTIVGAIRQIAGGPCIVVVGPPFGDQVAAHARALASELEIVVVDNPAPARGMASSVALGFEALQPYSERAGVYDAFLWPVDHPFVRVATLEALASVVGDVVRPVYRGRGGHPPLIRRPVWSRFAACTGVEGGARGVLSTLPVVDVSVDDPGVVRDVDTPEDRQAVS